LTFFYSDAIYFSALRNVRAIAQQNDVVQAKVIKRHNIAVILFILKVFTCSYNTSLQSLWNIF